MLKQVRKPLLSLFATYVRPSVLHRCMADCNKRLQSNRCSQQYFLTRLLTTTHSFTSTQFARRSLLKNTAFESPGDVTRRTLAEGRGDSMPRHGKPRSERIVCYASYVAVPAGQRMMASTVSAAGEQMRTQDLDGGKRYISRLVFIYGSTYITGTADGVDMHACVTLCPHV